MKLRQSSIATEQPTQPPTPSVQRTPILIDRTYIGPLNLIEATRSTACNQGSPLELPREATCIYTSDLALGLLVMELDL